VTFARVLLGALTFLVAAQAELARACPDCVVGAAARAQVWRDDFAFNLAVALIPFVFVGAVSAWADRIGRASNERS
jgi:hypothetical protein